MKIEIVMIAAILILSTVATITTTNSFHLANAQEQQQLLKPQQIQVDKIEDIFFSDDGTGSIEFVGFNYTSVAPGQDWHLTFKHSLTSANGYGWEGLPYPDCSIEYRRVGMVWYPNGTRLNPNTMNLSTVISEITRVPVGLVLPDVIKISNDTEVRYEKIGQILRPEEDAQFYEICGYVSDSQQEGILNRLVDSVRSSLIEGISD